MICEAPFQNSTGCEVQAKKSEYLSFILPHLIHLVLTLSLSNLCSRKVSTPSKMQISTLNLALISFAVLPSAFAASSCTSSTSLSWPPVGECNNPNKYPTAVQTCRACCLNDQPCFTACLKAAGIGARDIASEVREVSGRAIALTCGTNEGCYRYTDGSLLCLNLGTGKLLNFCRMRIES
jgi:hypothetical protein